jgi:tRNA G10  N-methylase Trm11
MIHFHPCLKFKSNFLSSLSDIYKYITQFYSFKISSNNIFSKIFQKDYEINMAPLTDKKISLRPNREYFLPIKLINLSKEVITSSKFQIIPKNNKLINIYLEGNKKFTLGANSNFTVKLKCITGSIKGKETITFYGFSEQLTLKNREQLNFNIEFEINDDLEEEKINKEFNNNENIIMFSKEHKSLALELLKSVGDTDRTNAHIKKVFNALLLNNWKPSKEIINKINATKK